MGGPYASALKEEDTIGPTRSHYRSELRGSGWECELWHAQHAHVGGRGVPHRFRCGSHEAVDRVSSLSVYPPANAFDFVWNDVQGSPSLQGVLNGLATLQEELCPRLWVRLCTLGSMSMQCWTEYFSVHSEDRLLVTGPSGGHGPWEVWEGQQRRKIRKYIEDKCEKNK